MKQSLKDFFEGVSIKNTLFLIIWTAGVIGYTIAIPMYQEMRKDADWAYSEAMKIHNQEDDGRSVSFKANETSTQVSLEAATEDQIAVASPSIEEIIYNYFKDDYEVAKAVFTAESHLNPRAKGYNCRYNGKSQACKKGDENKAWSVDCGIAQHNILGKDCPENLYNPDENIKLAREKYQSRRWQPWSAFKSEAYKKYLAKI